jgi:predicted MFS family arabinose efflux permease
MAACSLLLGLRGPQWLLLVVFGLSASGWNGIFLAEVARQVPPAQAGLATAAVLVMMTLGLVLGPLVFSAVAARCSFATAFAAWGGVGLLGVAALLQARRLQSRS